MSDFNVPGSRPKKTRRKFGNRPSVMFFSGGRPLPARSLRRLGGTRCLTLRGVQVSLSRKRRRGAAISIGIRIGIVIVIGIGILIGIVIVIGIGIGIVIVTFLRSREAPESGPMFFTVMFCVCVLFICLLLCLFLFVRCLLVCSVQPPSLVC